MSLDRYRARDLALPRYREELLAAITRDVTTDSRVRAAFVGGSLGAGDEDLYSDIDLRIVVDAADVDDFVANKTVRPQRWGSVLFYEDLGPRVAHTVAHFEGFIKVDCFYYRVAEVTPSLVLQNIRILHDPGGLVGDVHRRSQSLVYRPSTAEVERWRYKVLAYAHEVYRGCRRGELSYARKMLIGLAGYAMAGWHMEAARWPNLWADWAKAEGPRAVLSPWQQELLSAWHPPWSGLAILDLMATMEPELSRLNDHLSELTRCDPDHRVWKQAWDMVT
ncbi:aminoglycoside 6-adenylyltransferase [Sulfobacillus harzensis]|uniref:Polymerase nucleotidyl transferase domain-containing protein n=1 Tax=Sulfobacillus harzensis TaxID=2729629 RepID=A0A7Y0L7M2_9FIRM|nr:aminoglycoside 6-adenylyltransferase [Sulfobacillus harzensis]NMP24803.1 hypothetical protein [Sulfobacillus harzensis]